MTQVRAQTLRLFILSFLLVALNGPTTSSGIEGGGDLGLKTNLDLPYNAGGDTEEEEDAPEIITFYGGVYEANAVVFCLDESGSMKKNNRWTLQRREVTRAVSELSPEAEMGLVFYSREISAFRDTLVKAMANNKAAAIAFMNRRQPDGGTCIAQGVIKSLRMLQSSQSKYRSVIVAGDGKPSENCLGSVGSRGDPRFYRRLLQQTARANPGMQIRVHTIFVGTASDSDAINFMKSLAQLHNGTFRAVTR